jgi:hypothetical protein
MLLGLASHEKVRTRSGLKGNEENEREGLRERTLAENCVYRAGWHALHIPASKEKQEIGERLVGGGEIGGVER